jgi:hypothetical protein
MRQRHHRTTIGESCVDWFRRKQIASLSRPVAEWIEALGLCEEDAAIITGLPRERLAALVANAPSGVTAGEADQAYHALLMHSREHWGDLAPVRTHAHTV